MIPWPELPTLPDAAPAPDVIQLPDEFTKPAPRYGHREVTPAPIVAPAVAEIPTPIVASTPPAPAPAPEKPVARQGMLDSLNPFAGMPPTPTPRPAPTAQQAAPQTKPQTQPATRKGWDVLAKGKREDATSSHAPPDERRQAAGGEDLIHPARWAIPANPLRTIYRSQTLVGKLVKAINSDIPGQVKIELVLPLYDKFGYDSLLLDKGTIVIARQEGRPQYGSNRLAIVLEQLEPPSGEVIALQATIGDESGATGMSGKVNNHYGKLILYTGLSAILNIGVRQAAGTPGRGEFFQNPLQEAARDVGQSVQQSATDVLGRELKVPPTITIAAGTPITVDLLENIQFNRPPHVAR
jgi:type IV secretion system protein VirB10